eukprot:3437867-Prymnesium_polylepis.1
MRSHARLGGRVSQAPCLFGQRRASRSERPVKLNSNGHVATWRTTVRHAGDADGAEGPRRGKSTVRAQHEHPPRFAWRYTLDSNRPAALNGEGCSTRSTLNGCWVFSVLLFTNGP